MALVHAFSNVHMGESPVSEYLTKEQKEKIEVGLCQWKVNHPEFKPTEDTDKLFWILCEYDHCHAPSNWKDEYKHWDTIADWTKWFIKKHPKKMRKIFRMREKTKNDDRELCQGGSISNYLYEFMEAFFC
jgi:hypothetical protein